jgi:hypothetical protein
MRLATSVPATVEASVERPRCSEAVRRVGLRLFRRTRPTGRVRRGLCGRLPSRGVLNRGFQISESLIRTERRIVAFVKEWKGRFGVRIKKVLRVGPAGTVKSVRRACAYASCTSMSKTGSPSCLNTLRICAASAPAPFMFEDSREGVAQAG